MIQPKRLQKGDTVAVVSLSWGGLGDSQLIHKYYLGKKRLEEEFGLEVVAMPNALKGTDFVYHHPELRAKDLMDAFRDTSIKGIICAIGGDDTVRLIPYIDYDVIQNNPKIFMGYSDSTGNHFMMVKAGLVSFYGPAIMCDFAEYVSMFDYTKNAVNRILFQDSKNYRIESSPYWSKDYVDWDEKNSNVAKQMIKDEHGYEILQGTGKAKGHLLGGCLDVFMMLVGTEIWPSLAKWKGALLFWETSEEMLPPDIIKWTLRNLAAQGILKVIHGIIVGKPCQGQYYDEYKEVIKQVVAIEEGLTELPIVYNANFGHALPNGILPIGIEAEIDCEEKSITLLESATEEL